MADFDEGSMSREVNSLKDKFHAVSSSYGKIIKLLLVKWYYMVMIPAIIAAYQFLKVMNEKGYIEAFENNLRTSMESIINIATHCSVHFPVVWDILNCAGRY
ncbi:hypothetical protein [Rickettsiales endosymbiont of Stachyamoeba lipophora]|uniref:hypothetical protein n=1 Tax=Rickettsiales endosymbiont of Stachyamoeba lipophora TaxID=2486578 RepID=UPI000F6532D1|nr:hypothetical protein [Rickettsiales endosymbiont of Stachyamoeba lipophora]AZL15040.1 hypothetical protein EF513_00450 [Rickettsiales endosymbiont of Stachyamoeba lipophora]